jgi:hypothetical protein
MSPDPDHAAFEALAQSGAEDNDAAQSLASRFKDRTNSEQLKALAALWLNAAVAAPETLAGVYDASAQGWLGEPVGGPAIRTVRGLAPAAISPAFWKVFWALVAEGGGLGSNTRSAAALGELLSPEVTQRADRMAESFPAAGANAPAVGITPDALARCPPGSLGAAVLAISEAAPGASLRTRDFWRVTAGYDTTVLHQAAFSAFQLAQTGHPAPAKILAVMLARVAFQQPQGGRIVLPAALSAWTHGRRTPPLHPARWEKLWDKTPEEVRAALGVTTYDSPFPADLLEQAAA